MGRATIFLVGEDYETRRVMKQNLQSGGYRVFSAEGVDDALERVGGGTVPADLILLEPSGQDDRGGVAGRAADTRAREV